MASTQIPSILNCPFCDNVTEVTEAKNGANAGRYFFACNSSTKPNYPGPCTNPRGWFSFYDQVKLNPDGSVIPPETTSRPAAKRPTPPSPSGIHPLPAAAPPFKAARTAVEAEQSTGSKVLEFFAAEFAKLNARLDEMSKKDDLIAVFIREKATDAGSNL